MFNLEKDLSGPVTLLQLYWNDYWLTMHTIHFKTFVKKIPQ